MKIKNPIFKVPLELYTESLDLPNYSENIEYVLIEDMDLIEKEQYRIVFDTCKLNRVSFISNEFRKSEFIDCIFENCDLSNNTFHESTFMRCEFINCKLTGSHITESFLSHVRFAGCIGKYIDIADCKINLVEFNETNFDDGSFFQNTFKDVEFNNVHMEKASFYESSLKDIDLSTCDITSLKIDLKSIQGSIISSYQASEVCHLLGVKVKN